MDRRDAQATEIAVERRQYRRARVAIQVVCAAPECSEIRVTRDVSAGGLFLNMRFPLPVGSELSVSFRLYPAEPAVACRARVTFARVGVGMGIQFLDLPEGARRLLERFVDEAG